MLKPNDIEASDQAVGKPRFYRFGEFEMDCQEETLCRNDEKLRINRRSFQVLRLLVERAGEIVSKQEFSETVWFDTFVEDNSLTVTMTMLRKVLGDDYKQPTFIENLLRKGYRFIADVKIVDKSPAVPNASPVLQTDAPIEEKVLPAAAIDKNEFVFGNRKILVGICAAGLLLMLIVFGFNYFGSSHLKTVAANQSQIESIAVLPFENQNADTEYLSDGLTENIINNLTALPNLRVIGRNSVFEYKNKQVDLPTVGRELNVNAILTGTLLERDGNLIIKAVLTDARNNQKLWEREYNQPAVDTNNSQQKIAQDISETLRLKLTDEQRRRLAKTGTDNAEAYKLYLKGRYFWNKRTQQDLDKAIVFFNQAIEQDPTYAEAYVGLAATYVLGTSKKMTIEERSMLTQATVQKALEIDDNLGEAYAVLGVVNCFHKWDFAAAEKQYRRAIELNPNYATAHHWLGELLAIEGKFDESFAEYHRAIELDPLSLAIQTDLAMNYFYARQNDKALEYLQKLKAVNPNYARIEASLVGIYEEKKMYPEAIKAWENYCVLAGENPQQIADKIKPLENSFKTSGADGYWRSKLNVEANRLIGGDFGYAIIYARLGENDMAFENLEKNYAEHNAGLPYLKLRPEFDSLHSDPRFPDLVRRVGLPQ